MVSSMVRDTDDTGAEESRKQTMDMDGTRRGHTDTGRMSIQGNLEPHNLGVDSGDQKESLESNDSSRTREIRYETKSPHEEFEEYLQMRKMDRYRDAIGDPNTASDIGDAIDQTLKGSKAADALEETEDEKAMREWLHLKYGPTPFTEQIKTETVNKSEMDSDPFHNIAEDGNSSKETSIRDRSGETKDINTDID